MSSSLTPAEVARELNTRAGRASIYTDTRRTAADVAEGRCTPWRVSPEPFQMTAALAARIEVRVSSVRARGGRVVAASLPRHACIVLHLLV